MKIKFGEFEEVEEVTKVKEFLTEYFESVKPDKFESIFLAYPHQCFSDSYQPAKKLPETLEIYVFSLPEELEKAVQINRIEMIDPVGGNLFELYGSQRDTFRINGALPKDFNEVKDTQNIRLAVQRENQLWILFDLFHKFGSDSNIKKSNIEAVMNLISETIIHPLSEEEQEARLAKELGKTMMSSVTEQVHRLEAEVKAYEADIKTNESRTSQLLREYNDRQILIEQLSQTKKPNAQDMISKIKNMNLVEKFYLQGMIPTIETKQITLGPFNYGSWTIGLAKNNPRMKHECSGSVPHAYEYKESGEFCMGGFQRDYQNAMARGQLDIALSVARIEITNYSITTRMNSIEVYLRKIMGKDFDKILEKVRTDKFKTSDNIFISQIYGLEVTFIGTKDGSETGERVVIKYD